MSKQSGIVQEVVFCERMNPRLEVGFWRQRLFRNSYSHDGVLRRVKGWSVKIQHQGRRKTIGLGQVNKTTAAEKALSIYQDLLAGGWETLITRRYLNRKEAGTDSGRDPRSTTAYWKMRLVERRNRPIHRSLREYSCRIEHQGVGHYFPLGTTDETAAARKSLEIHRVVSQDGWEKVCSLNSRELTLAVFWSSSPLCCTYSTIYSEPSGERLHSTRHDTGISLLVVDGDPTIRNSLQTEFGRQPGFCCPTTCPDLKGLWSESGRTKPGLILVNRAFPDCSNPGFTSNAKRLFPGVSVVFYALYEDSEQLFNATTGSQHGYFMHRTPPGRPLDLLSQALASRRGTPTRIKPEMLPRWIRLYFRGLVGQLPEQPGLGTMPHLTTREHQVMKHLCHGLLDKEIAEALQISAWTVRNHLKNIYEKLGVHNRIEAVMEYLQK